MEGVEIKGRYIGTYFHIRMPIPDDFEAEMIVGEKHVLFLLPDESIGFSATYTYNRELKKIFFSDPGGSKFMFFVEKDGTLLGFKSGGNEGRNEGWRWIMKKMNK